MSPMDMYQENATEQQFNRIRLSAAFILIGAIPLINLLFVINFKTVKEKIKSAMLSY